MLTLISSLKPACFWDQSLFAAGEKGREGGGGGGAKGLIVVGITYFQGEMKEGGDNSSITEYKGTIVKNWVFPFFHSSTVPSGLPSSLLIRSIVRRNNPKPPLPSPRAMNNDWSPRKTIS